MEDRPENMNRPGSVRLAMALLYVVLCVGLGRLIAELPGFSEDILTVAWRIPVIAMTGFIGWMCIRLLGKRKNMFRVLFIVIIALSLPVAVVEMVHGFKSIPGSSTVDCIQISLIVASVVLLLRRSAHQWYRPVKQDPPQ